MYNCTRLHTEKPILNYSWSMVLLLPSHTRLFSPHCHLIIVFLNIMKLHEEVFTLFSSSVRVFDSHHAFLDLDET